MEKVVLHYAEDLRLNDEEFFRFCQDNPELKFERTKNGDIIFMALTGGETGRLNTSLNFEIELWNRQARFGVVFDSSTGFRLPDSSIKSPDVAVVAAHCWESLAPEQRKKFVPICPDFVLELKSPSDSLKEAKQEMTEWIENGCRPAWLLDPENQTAHVYRRQANRRKPPDSRAANCPPHRCCLVSGWIWIYSRSHAAKVKSQKK